ncbi:hypothetical protein ACIQXM_06920, partial [Arthrobacter sp. NPDC097144]|uniref:hypothetical protein n=1 Tax=Arthrobacter sp. NPDC097144 TaxID=3363946 RepID=UPI00381625D7
FLFSSLQCFFILFHPDRVWQFGIIPEDCFILSGRTRAKAPAFRVGALGTGRITRMFLVGFGRHAQDVLQLPAAAT